MNNPDRRHFLASVSCSLAALTAAPLLSVTSLADTAQPRNGTDDNAGQNACWLDVCAPFIIEDAARGIESEIVLTSDTFSGTRGYEEGTTVTEYELCLYDAAGRGIGEGGVTRRLNVPAMKTTVIPVRELIGREARFWGGLKIRLRPHSREMKHASDLFSSAFVRWKTKASFDNVHANPDPPQWQNTQRYYYSMPYPSLAEYAVVFSLFNPNEQRSAGEIVLHDPQGRTVHKQKYELNAHASLLFHLNTCALLSDPWLSAASSDAASKSQAGGLLAITNDEGTAKSFGYLMIHQPTRQRFSVEHPIHQGVFKPKPVVAPFDTNGQFKAKNILYTPLLFRAKRMGDITLESRIHLGTGLPLEEAQWFYPFAVDGQGQAVWSAIQDEKLACCLPAGQVENKVIRLAAGQSCTLDFNQLALPADFAGGLAVAVSPDTTHTLIKLEVRIPEWKAFAFTHFRPGLRSARSYQAAQPRGGLATDYIVSGARLVTSKAPEQFDEIIAVLNIDDSGKAARPTLELFDATGMRKRLSLGTIPAFACRHYRLSELLPGEASYGTLSLRLLDEQTTLLMSAIHLDYVRRDIALDHGSDHFSTFLDYGCR